MVCCNSVRFFCTMAGYRSKSVSRVRATAVLFYKLQCSCLFTRSLDVLDFKCESVTLNVFAISKISYSLQNFCEGEENGYFCDLSIYTNRSIYRNKYNCSVCL